MIPAVNQPPAITIGGAGTPMHASLYDLQTGLFVGREVIGNAAAIEANTPPGCGVMEGQHDHLSRRVDLTTGKVIDWIPPQPADTPLHTHVWDAMSDPKRPRWREVETTAGVALRIRAHRDALLAACDWAAVRSLDLGLPMPRAWQTYRQALRDVTQQPGFPQAIDWPCEPQAR